MNVVNREEAHRALIASRHTECCPQFNFIGKILFLQIRRVRTNKS
jgi:hypothetical protein